MKKRYQIEVDCANCAAKMEAAVRKLPGITDASVNHMTQKMTLEFADDADISATMAAVVTTCKKIDSDFSIEM